MNVKVLLPRWLNTAEVPLLTGLPFKVAETEARPDKVSLAENESATELPTVGVVADQTGHGQHRCSLVYVDVAAGRVRGRIDGACWY